MRINGTFGFDPKLNGPQGPEGKAVKADRSEKSGEASGIHAEPKSLIDRALEVEDVRADAVSEAKTAYEAEQLSVPEAIRRAARAMMRFGA